MTDKDLDAQAREILRGNSRGGYTIPTSGLYPYQWNWDSVFSAWGFAEFDIDRAWKEIETLFTGQWENGMVPHIIFHQPDPGYFPGPDVWGTQAEPPTSGISQPPIAATFARMILAQDDGQVARMRALWPKMLAWHRWYMMHRCEDGLIATTHPWETGRDNSPDWDKAMAGVDTSGVGAYTRRDTAHVNADMRPKKEDYDRYLAILYAARDHGWDEGWIRANGLFRVIDPGLTFILLRAHRDLAAIGAGLGEETSEIDGWITQMEAALPRMWNDATGAYDARDVRTGVQAGGVSSSAFLAWYAGIEEPRLLDRLAVVRAGGVRGVPSFDPASPLYDGLRYWRGPTWGVINTLIGIGLAEQGHEDMAEAIRTETADLIRKGGFHEYFDPREGTPAGGGAFSWTAAIWLRWASDTAGQGRG